METLVDRLWGSGCIGTLIRVGTLTMLLWSVGCAKEEKVLDLKAPGVDIEVKKSDDGVKINVERKDE